MAELDNPRRERFCREYVIDLNGTQAATRAGYSARTANEQAARLLTNVSVRARIAELQAAVAERTEITADQIVKDLQDLGKRAAVAEQFSASIRAKELVGKHLGMWPNKLDATVNFLDGLNADEQRAVRAALEAIARDKGEDAEGTNATHH